MNSKTSPKDFFLHLGAVIALYASAIALMDLAFTVIDRLFPDALSNYFSASSVVWPISMLIVLVPALYALEWTVARDIVRMPEKRAVWVRRWRIYLTLFLTGATIVGDLIALINTYLNGEVTSRFILKVLAVLIVCAVLFAYYLLERMSDSKNVKKPQSALAWLGIVLVLTAIVGGFVLVGSPATQRSIRFDEQRVSDLTSIQYQITDYWQQKGTLPFAIQALNDPLANFTVPVDPQTGAAYGYAASNASNFSICATFDLPSSADPSNAYNASYPTQPAALRTTVAVGSNPDSWAHPAGHACFDRTIDPSRYPPAIKSPAV